MNIDFVRTTPRPVLMVMCPPSLGDRRTVARKVFDILAKARLSPCHCRGVALDRLPHILSHGCDVSPTNSPLFVAEIDKAVEYGGVEQVIQVFDHLRMKRTFVEVSTDADPNEIEALKNTYVSWETSADGNKIWFSMLPFDDRRRTTDYEIAYGWFIPGNPWDALSALAIFVESDSARDTVIGLLDSYGGDKR